VKRLDAIEHLPKLLDALATAATKTTDEIRAKLGHA
jgi:hypothetical protein